MRRLTVEEMAEVCGGRGIPRIYDSTDFAGWDEVSTGDYEWALQNFMDDVNAGVKAATAAAANQAQAEQLARDYLASVGLSSVVSVNSTQPGDIVITATRYEVPNLPFVAPALSMNYSFADLDASTVFHELDESVHTIEVQFERALTDAEKQAIETLRTVIAATTAMLESLPANGYFLKDGKMITVAELKEKWSKVDIVLTDKIYTNGTPQNPGVGAAIFNGGNPIFEVNISALVQFMSNPQSAKWWPLHELVHVTAAGYGNTVAFRADGILTQTEHETNEWFANSITHAIALAAGQGFVNFLPGMGWGNEHAQFVVPSPPPPPPPPGGGYYDGPIP